MATGPKVATTPLEVLTNDCTQEPPILSKLWGPVIGAGLGFIGVIGANFLSRRPIMAGVQFHVLATVVGAGIGQYLENYRNEYFAEREAVFRHYVQLHPEDFPPFKRVKYGDVLEPWIPIR